MSALRRQVMLSGRFRSGTTALWNLFNQASDVRAYYEPLHPQLRAQIAHVTPMASHLGVDDYWRAYRDLPDTVLDLHRAEFAFERLHLDSDAQWPELSAWINALLAHAPQRAVLKFNRACLRLGWLRSHWPDAFVVHIRRDVRESFVSARAHLPEILFDAADAADAFELLQHCAGLASEFPFLLSEGMDSAYARHYVLWRLAELMAMHQADLCLDLDRDLRAGASSGLDALGSAGLLDTGTLESAASLLAPATPPRALELRDAQWFACIEHSCDRLLEDLGLSDDYGRRTLTDIRLDRADLWGAHRARLAQLTRPLLNSWAAQGAEITRLLRIVRELEAARDASIEAAEAARIDEAGAAGIDP